MHHGQHNCPCGGWFQGPFDHDEYNKPLGCNRAHVALTNGRLRCKGHSTVQSPPPDTVPATSFQQTLLQLTPTQRYILQGTIFTEDNIEAIACSIEAGDAIVVSNSSYHKDTKTATFELRLETDQKPIRSQQRNLSQANWRITTRTERKQQVSLVQCPSSKRYVNGKT